MSSAKLWSFCPGLNLLKVNLNNIRRLITMEWNQMQVTVLDIYISKYIQHISGWYIRQHWNSTHCFKSLLKGKQE